MFDLFPSRRLDFSRLDKTSLSNLGQWNMKVFEEAESLFKELDTFFDDAKGKYVVPQTPKYPPTNILKKDNSYTIEMAVAGYSKNELEATLKGNLLTIKGSKIEDKVEEEGEEPIFVQRGISARTFERTFTTPKDSTIDSVSLENGMLTIVIQLPVKEEKKEEHQTLEIITK